MLWIDVVRFSWHQVAVPETLRRCTGIAWEYAVTTRASHLWSCDCKNAMLGLARTGQRIGDQGNPKTLIGGLPSPLVSALMSPARHQKTTPWRRVGGSGGAVMAPGEPAGAGRCVVEPGTGWPLPVGRHRHAIFQVRPKVLRPLCNREQLNL